MFKANDETYIYIYYKGIDENGCEDILIPQLNR